MSFDSTQARIRLMIKVSIPLEQGNVFRLQRIGSVLSNVASQSLWNRAMSFDMLKRLDMQSIGGLNPFGTGQCLSTQS